MPNFEPLTLCTGLILTWRYLVWTKHKSLPAFLWVASAAGLAAASDWPAYFLLGALFIHALCTELPRRQKVLATALPVIACVSFALFLGRTWFLGERYLRHLKAGFALHVGLSEQSARRLGLGPGEQGGDTDRVLLIMGKQESAHYHPAPPLTARLYNHWVWGNELFTVPVLVLSGLGGILLLAQFKQGGDRIGAGIVLAWLLMATLYVSIFAYAAFVHPYWIYYYGVPASLLSGYCLASFKRPLAVWTILSIFAIMSLQATIRRVDREVPIAYGEGKAVARLTSERTVILVPETSYRRQLGFYAKRRIGFGVDNLEEVKTLINGTDRPVAFLRWPMDSKLDEALESYLAGLTPVAIDKAQLPPLFLLNQDATSE